MKKYSLLLICTLLFASGCSNFGPNKPEIIQPDDENVGEISIIPKHTLSEQEYKMILPFQPSAARGAITGQIYNRIDVNEMEEGLRRHSTSVFNPEKLLFEEGQFLSTRYIFSLIEELYPKIEDMKDKDKLIKKYRDNPRIFSHVLEQNYLKRTKDNSVELEGISLGISLRSVYRFQTEIGGPYYYENIPDDVLLEEGKQVANRIFNELRDREGLGDIPVMIALFKEEKQSSPVPGNFIAKTFVGADEVAVGKWEAVEEEHVLFPSNNSSKNFAEDHQTVSMFSAEIASYFPNFVGVVGDGFYVDESLKRLSLEIPIDFFGQSEVIGFTQYTYGLVQKLFVNQYDIEVTIVSNKRTESVIFRSADETEAKVHIFH